MNQILQNLPMTVFGDGEQVRAFSYIGDVAPLLAEAIDLPAAYNQVFNIGADEPYSVNALAEAVAHAMGEQPRIAYLPPRHEALSVYSADEKIRRVFGHRPVQGLEDGLARMAAWAKQHRARQSQIFDDIEVTRIFPPDGCSSTASSTPSV